MSASSLTPFTSDMARDCLPERDDSTCDVRGAAPATAARTTAPSGRREAVLFPSNRHALEVRARRLFGAAPKLQSDRTARLVAGGIVALTVITMGIVVAEAIGRAVVAVLSWWPA